MNLWFMGGAAVLDKERGKIVGQLIQNSGQHAPVGGYPRDSQVIHTVKVQRLIEIGLEKSAEAAFGQPDICGDPNQPIGHFGAFGTADTVFLHFPLENEIPLQYQHRPEMIPISPDKRRPRAKMDGVEHLRSAL